ncbi:energy-coupling factor ABC transporter ATP-binding protein [Oceanospirillum sediminis]|uniref:ATP-binding cassette domain-containing protein n=1 Tax=Oceanospirillum sediminis TaxID=2760088 RepID=A0A839IU17_9GAMM|nr:ABC transporter ATP-binding protein [Oceanospirillum sediminis]MBB1488845.1 ATP-binding cassette domain-containing protein [Oceanospirillum sediminis]
MNKPLEKPITQVTKPITQGCSIHLDEVCLEIEGKQVVNKLSLSTTIKRLGVIGRNGSGKSTLSRLLSGLIETSSGHIEVAGINPFKDRKGALREIGLLFQNPEHQIIFPTVIEEIAFGLRQQGQNKKTAEQNALQVLASFGKEHWQNVHTSALSQGQKHLVCLMAVMAMKPNLIILDEPFAGLDIPTKKQLRRYLDKFSGSLIHISHDPEDLNGYEQLLWLEGGEVAALGRYEEVLPRYLNEMDTLGDSDDISDLAS